MSWLMAKEWCVRVQCNVVTTCFHCGGVKQLSTLRFLRVQASLSTTIARQVSLHSKGHNHRVETGVSDISEGTFIKKA